MTTIEQQRIAIENRLNRRRNHFDAKALQIDHDIVWLLGRVGELESELLRQWRAKHATHCEGRPTGSDECPVQTCGWPKPAALTGACVLQAAPEILAPEASVAPWGPPGWNMESETGAGR